MAKPDDKREHESKTPSDNDTITMTIGNLRTLISEARAPAPPAAPTLEEAFEAHQRMMHEATSRPIVSWYVAFRSLDTNARGVAYVTASRRHATGRVINLPHYEYPPGSDRTIANGGLCAMNEIVDQHGQPTAAFKQWRYEFWKTDLRGLVGGEAKKLDALGPYRPTLEDALADLKDWSEHEAKKAQEPATESGPIPAPEIVARGASAP